MSIESLKEALKQLIVKYSRVTIDKSNINEDSDLVGDFSFDSVSLVKIIVEIEKTFGIEIEDEMLNFNVIGRYKFLEQYLVSRLCPEHK